MKLLAASGMMPANKDVLGTLLAQLPLIVGFIILYALD